jgi:hypothetical protein
VLFLDNLHVSRVDIELRLGLDAAFFDLSGSQ